MQQVLHRLKAGKEMAIESIRSAKHDDIYGASNFILPCPGI
jgi:hypothetical protein